MPFSSASEIVQSIKAKKVSCVEVATEYLAKVQALDPTIAAFLTVDAERCLSDAAAIQVRIDAGEDLPLAGVPIAIKDNISTLGIATTCASKILEGYIPPYDATAILMMKSAGGVILGKTNLDEFAMGGSTETSAYQITKNPWDLDRSPGGSSGGSAAAVAAGMATLALGSDTGGSIRQPASLCGIVGFKPTYGRCSRYGLVAFGSSLDQIGPFARNVEDAALLAAAITGPDENDATCLDDDPIRLTDLKLGSLRGIKIALPKELFTDALDSEVREDIERAIKTLSREGVEFTDVSLPSIKFGVTTYYIIAPSEASSNLARFDGVRFGPRIEGNGHIETVEKTRGQLFGHEVKSRIMIGTYALSAGYYDAYYTKAQQVRALMQQEINRCYQDFDLILGPTSPIPAFKLGDLMSDPMAMKMVDYCTIPANMGGYPAISLFSGVTGGSEAPGLPVGVHLMAAVRQDEKLLQLAYVVEKALGGAPIPPHFAGS